MPSSKDPAAKQEFGMLARHAQPHSGHRHRTGTCLDSASRKTCDSGCSIMQLPDLPKGHQVPAAQGRNSRSSRAEITCTTPAKRKEMKW